MEYPTLMKIIKNENILSNLISMEINLSVLEEWVSEIEERFPQKYSGKIKKILTHKSKEDLLDRVIEIGVFAKLLKGGIQDIKWEPTILENNEEKHPDFELKINNTPVILEIKRVRKTYFEQYIEKKSNEFTNKLQNIILEKYYKHQFKYQIEIHVMIDFGYVQKNHLNEDKIIENVAKIINYLLYDKGIEKIIKEVKNKPKPTSLDEYIYSYDCRKIFPVRGIMFFIRHSKEGSICCKCYHAYWLIINGQKKNYSDITDKVKQLSEKEISILLFKFEGVQHDEESRYEILSKYGGIEQEVFAKFPILDSIICYGTLNCFTRKSPNNKGYTTEELENIVDKIKNALST